MTKGLRTLFSTSFRTTRSKLTGSGSRATAPERHRRFGGLLVGAALALLTACGGGGGGGGGFIPDEPGGDLTRYTLELSVVDANGNPTSEVSDTAPARLLVTVREDNFNAAPVSGVVVSANADFAVIAPDNGQALTNAEGVAEFEIRAGATLGADTITITVPSPAGEVTATIGVSIGGSGLTLGYFDGTTFIAGQIGLSTDALSFRGSAVLRLAVVDANGTPVTAARQIRLSSACSLSGLAKFRPVGDTGAGSNTLTIDTVDGLAEAEYLAGNCEDGDDLTATLIDGDSTATASVTIAASDANFIGYLSTDPAEGVGVAARTIIALKGTGGANRPEAATVTFEILEEPVALADGDPQPGEPGYLDLPGRKPLAGVEVTFSLASTAGGITLNTTSGVSDSNGLVRVVVRAGNVATSTQVIASFDADNGDGTTSPQSAGSNQIIVGTGLAQQNGISVSVSDFHPVGAAGIDGIESTITVRLVDRFGNPVTDGTSVVFRTEYGAIDTSCVTGVSNGLRVGGDAPQTGTCSVLWTSQAPRFPVFDRDRIQTIEDDNSYDCPSHTGSFGPCPDDLGAIRGLRSTVTITVVGEEFFVDANGNGRYDEGETFENLPEAFTDHNEDGVYTPFAGPNCPPPSSAADCEAAGAAEEFIDFNNDGEYNENVDPNTGEGVYNGSLCPPEGDGVFCSRELVHVRASTFIVLAASAQDLTVLAAKTPDNPAIAGTTLVEGFTYNIHVSDIFNNGPGTGTVLDFEGVGDCAIAFPVAETQEYSETVPNRLGARGAYTTRIRISGVGSGGGRLTVSATDPNGGATYLIGSFACSTSCQDPVDPLDPTQGCNDPFP